MSTISYTSINSVLYDLSTTIPEQYWNETVMLEWAYKALHKINMHTKYHQTVAILQVESHKAQLPKDLKYITQIVYREELTDYDVTFFQDLMNITSDSWNPTSLHMSNTTGLPSKAVNALFAYSKTYWKPLRLSSNPFVKTIHSDISLFTEGTWDYLCPQCAHEYTVDPDLCLTTTLKDGYLLVSYLRMPTCVDGSIMIPDDEDVKEAIFHYVLYRYFLKRSFLKEEGAEQQRDWHLLRFETLKIKASGKAHQPSIDQLENIKAERDHLVPKGNRYSGMFSQLGQYEVDSPFYNKNLL